MKINLQSKKHFIFDFVLILVVTGLTAFYLAKSGVFSHLDSLTQMSVIGLITIILVFVAAVLFHSYVYYNSGKAVGENLSFVKSTNAYMLGFMGSGITPLKSGHFPFIFYYYSKQKVPFEKSLSIVCTNQIVFSLTTVITYFIIMILCLVNKTAIIVGDTTIYLWLAALAGFVFNIGSLLLVVLLAYCSPFHNFAIKTCSKILYKLKKIDSREDYENEHKQKIQTYKAQIDYVFKHLYKFILPILSFFLFLIFISSIPYVIYLFFSGAGFNINDFLLFFSLNQAMTYITNVIPVPGGTGVAEFSFLTIFAGVFTESTIGSAMIIWRVCTYYLPILISFLIFIGVMIKNRTKPNTATQIKF